MEYKRKGICNRCSSNHFLRDNLCVPLVSIPNCLTHAAKALVTTCVQCMDGFVVIANACVPRVVTVAFCSQYVPDREECLVCQPNYLLLVPTYCIKRVLFCTQYTIGASGGYECYQCGGGYYINRITKTCVSGKVPYCEVYVRFDENTCERCRNGYELRQNVCVNFPVIRDCEIYEQHLPGNCLTCRSGYTLFTLAEVCTPITTIISNCAVYSDVNTCLSCDSGYYIKNKVCVKTPEG